MRRLRLARDLGFWDAVFLGVGFIIGSGIFIMPVLAAQTAGSWSILAWIAAGFYTIITGLCFAELAVRIPKAGGLYAYAHKELGSFLGFFTGYAFWLGYWITIAAETLALAWYLSFFTSISFESRIAISVFIALVFTAINYRGVKLGGETEDFLTVGKLIPLGILILIGLPFFSTTAFSAGFHLNGIAQPQAQDVLAVFFSSLILVLWAYQGVEIITVPEEEIKNAKKTVPKAIIVAVVSVMIIYSLIALVVLGSVDWKQFVSSESALADVAVKLAGEWGGVLLALGGLVSILGALNAVILAAARISFAMARDDLFPGFFSHVHEKHRTPDYALVIHFLFATILVWFYRDFVFLASLVVLFTLVPWFFSCLSALRMQRETHKHSLFNHEAIPALATFTTLILILYLLQKYWVYAGVATVAGIGYYLYKIAQNKNRAVPTGAK